MTMLAIKAQQVAALRTASLLMGGPAAAFEAQRMVAEKVWAAGEAAATVAAGGEPRAVVRAYRHKVRANKRRLAKAKRSPETS